MRRRIVLGGVLMAGVLSIAVAAQQQAPPGREGGFGCPPRVIVRYK